MKRSIQGYRFHTLTIKTTNDCFIELSRTLVPAVVVLKSRIHTASVQLDIYRF